METDIPDKVWVAMHDANEKQTNEEKGAWVQRATFKLKMHLKIPPTFAISIIQLDVRPRAARGAESASC